MSDFNNITVNPHDDQKVSLLIDGKPISEKFGVQFESSIVEELKALEEGKALQLFDQFIFSHSDLNFEHKYRYVTSMVKSDHTFTLQTNFVYHITAEGKPPMENAITNQGQLLTHEEIQEFINKNIQTAMSQYTDLKYAY
ncbi:hypothetical protein AMD27_09095 [Acinetobacter sp. TGL-Y2]|uniref:hypothetical protein n=1 Tax=Acinetobacter sp. TGL-Y2 TaxID=1407071 RepID=UPI0007A64A8D|nr:hypothetical protein [Acinetobacter sp. TGL-Y2]AMW79026.1 hypothetical protein AMD27_09095 [Acinetobacter sp. TGL-Y2]